MSDLSEFLPVRLRIYKRVGDDNPATDEIVLGEVTDTDDGLMEFGFNIHNSRHYVAFRWSDLRRALRDCGALSATADQPPASP